MTQTNSGKKLSESELRDQYKRSDLEQKAKNGSSYFYWIAFFAVLNQVMDKLASERSFVFGLGIPQYVNTQLASANSNTLWGIIIALAVLFVVIGFFAQRKNQPIYIAGIAIYLVDMVFAILAQDVVSAVMHVVFTVLLVMGLIAMRKLTEMPQSRSK